MYQVIMMGVEPHARHTPFSWAYHAVYGPHPSRRVRGPATSQRPTHSPSRRPAQRLLNMPAGHHERAANQLASRRPPALAPAPLYRSIYSFWKRVSDLERAETKRYLEMFYTLRMRPLVAAMPSFQDEDTQPTDAAVDGAAPTTAPIATAAPLVATLSVGSPPLSPHASLLLSPQRQPKHFF